jgi:uncharacterized phage infection (PIP) family protein YhgE
LLSGARAAKESEEKIRHTKELADNGVAVTVTVGRSLANINESAGKSADVMKEIARETEEQTSGIGHIAAAISELEKVTQQNSAAAEESSAASEQLTSQAVKLDDVIRSLVSLVFGAKGAEREDTAGRPAENQPRTGKADRRFENVTGSTGKASSTASDERKNQATHVYALDESDIRGF